MFDQLIKKCFPSSDASPKDFRISGAIFMVTAIPLGGIIFATLMTTDQMNLMPMLLLLPIILWLVGMHRLLWAGTVAANRWLNMGRVAVTAIVGFVSLGIVSGVTGAVIGFVKRMTA